MNPQSLHALIIDRHAGELSPEAVELLELHLSQDAAARVEADRILQALHITRDAVLQHPELARVTPPGKAAPSVSRRPAMVPWIAWAAAAALIATIAGAGGFMAGRAQQLPATNAKQPAASPVIAVAQVAPRKQSPWAQYRMTYDPAGQGMQVVRVDSANQEN